MIGEFTCPECGDTTLFLYRKDETSTALDYDKDSTDFRLGKEEVINTDGSYVQCGNGHGLELEDGTDVEDLAGFKLWLYERKQWEEAGDTDPFSLYYINCKDTSYTEDQINRAKEVSQFLIKILDEMVENLISIGESCGNQGAMEPVVAQIKALEFAGVGVGDTATDECIAGYVEEKLKDTFPNTYEKIGHDFYYMYHH